MKKHIYLFLFFAFLVCFSADAQWSFGIQGGINHSWHTITVNVPKEGMPRLQGTNTSILLYKKLNKFIEIGAEPGVARRGADRSSFTVRAEGSILLAVNIFVIDDLFEYHHTSLQATYFQIPLTTKVNWPLLKGKLALFVKAGGGPSWLSEAFVKNAFNGPVGNGPFTKIDFNENKGLHRWDWGFYGSAGIQVKVGPGHLLMNMDNYTGLSNIMEKGSAKNKSVGYSFGYTIDL